MRRQNVGVQKKRLAVIPPQLSLTVRIVAQIISPMNCDVKYLLLGFLLLDFTIAGVSDAASYLDPGSGSILFQSIIAVVASGVAVFATTWKSIAGFFSRIFNQRGGDQGDKR